MHMHRRCGSNVKKRDMQIQGPWSTNHPESLVLKFLEHYWVVSSKGKILIQNNGLSESQGVKDNNNKHIHTHRLAIYWLSGFLSSSDGKESACNAGDHGSITGSGKFPGEGHGNPLQYSCLENLMDRGGGGLKSSGSQRVGHNWVTNTFTFY